MLRTFSDASLIKASYGGQHPNGEFHQPSRVYRTTCEEPIMADESHLREAAVRAGGSYSYGKVPDSDKIGPSDRRYLRNPPSKCSVSKGLTRNPSTPAALQAARRSSPSTRPMARPTCCSYGAKKGQPGMSLPSWGLCGS
jgi:hypothetical protein